MATALKAGGPAFPCKPQAVSGEQQGMSLRDYFAAKALVGWMQHGGTMGIRTPQQQAEMAYRYADAMLAARSAT